MTSIQLMAVIFIVASIAGPPESAACSDNDPCKKKSCASRRYHQFVHKHVLKEEFDRNSNVAWESYLKKKDLWNNNRPIQSFLEKSQNVEDICTSGKRVQNGGDLCISTSKMEVYDVIKTMDNNCVQTIVVNKKQTFVVVACNKVGNQCLPVHFEQYEGQSPSNSPC